MRKSTYYLVGAAGLTIALALAPAHETGATPISASMNLNALATLGGVTNTSSDNEAWGVPLSPLSVVVNANVTSAAGNSVTTSGAGSATWAGGNSGSVLFNDYGWIWVGTSTPGSRGSALSDHTGGNDWSYTFTADGDGNFTMEYNVTGSGDRFGLSGWDILWSGSGGGLSLTNAVDPTASGAFTRALVAGNLYTVQLRTNANVFTSGPSQRNGSMDGTFDWSITVPEPASVTLVGIGLALLASSRRRGYWDRTASPN